MNALEKYANIAKVRAFLARGMGLKEAIKAAYPDYTPEQVAALAAKMGGGAEKTAKATLPTQGVGEDKGSYLARLRAFLSKGSLRPINLGRNVEKTAAVPLIGAGAGYLKGADSKRGAEGAIKGALGSGVGGLAGGLLAAPAAIAMADKKKLDMLSKLPKHPALRDSKISRMAALGPKSLAAIILGVTGGSIAGYKALTKGVDKPKGKKKTSAAKKVTFSPAMDKSPSLKGGQSKLPDHIQSAILKKKLKKKTGSVKMNALEKYVAKTKLAHALTEKLAAPTKDARPIVSTGMAPIGGPAGSLPRVLRSINAAKKLRRQRTALDRRNIRPALELAGGATIMKAFGDWGRKKSRKASDMRKKLAPPGRRGPEWKVTP